MPAPNNHRDRARPHRRFGRPRPRYGRPRPRFGRLRSRTVRLLVLLLLAIGTAMAAVGTGTSPTWADPTPSPVPGVPGPGVPPVAGPSPTPSPPTGSPSPSESGATVPGPPDWNPPIDSGSDGSGNEAPGLFDIPGQIRKAISDFLAWVAATGLKPVMNALGKTVLATPDLTNNPQVTAIWTTSLVAANAIFVLFIIAGGFIITTRHTLQSQYGLKEIAPRVVVAAVAANTSLLICGKAIEFTNALTAAITGQGTDSTSAVTAIEQMLTQPASAGDPAPILFSLLILAAMVMGIVVLVTFILRTTLLVLLLGVAPLALTCHATPATEALAYTWWRAVAACLGIQLGQAIILLATVRVFLTPAGPEALGLPATRDGLVAVLVCLTMLWLLIKLPGWMKHLILGPLGRRHGRGLAGQIIHAVVMRKILGSLAGIHRSPTRPTRSASTPRPTAGPSPSPGGSTARPISGGPHPPRPPRTRTRRGPSPAGPAPFSDAPTSHSPMPAPAGSSGAPVFSSAPTPATPASAPNRVTPAARFSHQPSIQPAVPAPAGHPTRAVFSTTAGTVTPRRPAGSGPVPPVGFSAAPKAQTAPKRPPAPAAPVFSTPALAGRRGAAGGTGTTRSVPARPQRLVPPSPPSPPGSATARRNPTPSPLSSPSSSPWSPGSSPSSPPGRPARRTPSPPRRPRRKE